MPNLYRSLWQRSGVKGEFLKLNTSFPLAWVAFESQGARGPCWVSTGFRMHPHKVEKAGISKVMLLSGVSQNLDFIRECGSLKKSIWRHFKM